MGVWYRFYAAKRRGPWLIYDIVTGNVTLPRKVGRMGTTKRHLAGVDSYIQKASSDWTRVSREIARLSGEPKLRSSPNAIPQEVGPPEAYSASKHAVKGFTDALRVEIEEVDKSPVSITLIQPTAVNTPYPQHARNYMAQEPRLPTPMIEPKQVAEAILDAAVKPTRATKVGMMAKVNTIMADLLPAAAGKMSATQADRQHYDEPPRHTPGALFEPSETTTVGGKGNGSGQPSLRNADRLDDNTLLLRFGTVQNVPVSRDCRGNCEDLQMLGM